MRTTIALDDDLIRTAQEFTGLEEKTALVRVLKPSSNAKVPGG